MSKTDPISLSYIRFFHALPIKYGIDIYIDNKLRFNDVLYEDFTEYIALPPGQHTVHLSRTKNPIVLCSKVLNISDQKIYTSTVAPKSREGTGIDIYKIEDVLRTIPSNNFLIRFGHSGGNSAAVDVFLSDDVPLFKRVSYSEITNYTPKNPGIYTLQLKESKTGKVLVSAPNIRLKPSRFYSIYTLGNGSKEYPHIVVIPLDGNSYLKL